jgi:bla regulator protein blaR1
MIPIANHLWQSTLFALAVLLLTIAFHRNRAEARYWLWLAASIKFLIPFSPLVSAGSQIEWRAAPAIAPAVSAAAGQINEPFALSVHETSPVSRPDRATPAAAIIWFCGCAAVLGMWWTRWRRMRAVVRQASSCGIEAPIPVLSSPTLIEPGVFGILRPVLLLPEGITGRLTRDQLSAILAHELCHVRRRDNLTAAVHMAVEAIFWFHPLVWWIGSRLVHERERACDEEVVRLGNQPQVYAESIVNVCKFYLQSPLPCAPGVTGSDLKKRVAAIMANRAGRRLTFTRKLLLAAAGMAAVAGPILIGVTNAPVSRAQSKTEVVTFEVASVKPSSPDARGLTIDFTPGGGLRTVNARLRQLIEAAYDVHNFQISGGPAWLNSQGFDILAKPPQPEGAAADMRRMTDEAQRQLRQRLQALLTDRFQLVIHRGTKEMPIYALVLGKSGPKLKESTGEGHGINANRSAFTGSGATMQLLAQVLARRLGRPVLDRTGLNGKYDFTLEWTPDAGGPAGKEGPAGPNEKAEQAGPGVSGPTIFTALQEQLGLKLESQRGPVEIIIIDRAEKPAAN